MTEPSSPLLLGIDPGYDRVGWAVGHRSATGKLIVLACDCIQTNNKQTIMERYKHIAKNLTAICAQWQPKLAAIETLYFAKNKTTALRVSEARGVIISTLLTAGLAIEEHHPRSIKLAVTGDGAATKQAVEKMIRLQVQLADTFLLDDTLDAIAVLLTQVVQTPTTKTA